MRRWFIACCAAFAACVLAPAALAQFPYPAGVNAPESPAYRLAPGVTPSNFTEAGDWELAGTPDTSTSHAAAGQATVDNQGDQLCGVTGISVLDQMTTEPTGCLAGQPVRTAMTVSTGNPDVHIAVLDSGIKWNDPGVMASEAEKVWLNTGELPAPRHDLSTSLVPGESCARYTNATGGDYDPLGNYAPDGHGGVRGGRDDVNGDGVVNLADWACDSRVKAAMSDPRRHGPPGILTPEDLIIAFSDGVDHDGNGYASDIAGWNYVDDNNDPFDDVQYGHGSGEAEDSTAEAGSTASTVGTCPNCMVMPLRVGESFVTDANRFAEAALYATDEGADVIQEALGTLNAPRFAREAIDYAYRHGTTVIASAADEAAEHHNQPGALPHTIVVNSVNQPDSISGVGVTDVPPSYLQLNGCTNFSTRVDLAVEGSSCSSESTGKSSGVVGLMYSAAENATRAGSLAPSGDCMRVDGTPCLITPNEVRQLMASGDIGSRAPADQGGEASTQANDVNFAQQPEPSCAVTPVPTCTDPNLNTVFALDMLGGLLGPAPDTFQYPARKGFDEFYGYGRLNAYKAVASVAAAQIPPEVDITSPDWFTQVDPGQSTMALGASLHAREPYTCQVEVAPGVEPNNAPATAGGDFHPVSSGFCDGTTVHSGPFDGTVATIDIAALKALFPPGMPSSFTGNENGGLPQTSNGRPNTQPYGFTVRVVASTARGTAMSGEDRRQLFLHRDAEMLAGWPRELQADGDSSPVLADIEGSDRNDLMVATSDGIIHAYRADGSEAPGWPVHTDPLPLHLGERAFSDPAVGSSHDGAVLGGLAAGDLFHTGAMDVVASDEQGNVYAWNGSGRLVFHQHSNPAFSGAPPSPFATVRQGPRDRTEAGFVSAPVLANLAGGPGPLDIVAAGEDRHLYAWHPDGRPVAGFPVLIADPDKLAAVDPTTHHLAFNHNVKANPGISEDQGKLIDTPAVAALDGPGRAPSIIIGSNEEYTVNTGDEGPINASGVNTASLGVLGQTGVLTFANGRVYAVKATGGSLSCSAGRCRSDAFRAGWPKKVGIIDEGLLPDVGEGINGSPVVAPLSCPSGGGGEKIGVSPDAGPGYIFNADGSSCYGALGGQDTALATDLATGNGSKQDLPVFAAVGYPSFGTLDGRTLSMFDQGAGLIRALDVVVNGYQRGGQDFIEGWNASSGQFDLGFPAVVNDLGFLTGETVGDITGGAPAQEVLGGTASLDVAAFDAAGKPASPAWPKLSGDWLVATPTLGSFGTLDSTPGARKDVVTITRSGTLSVYGTPAAACSPSSWPSFHHDIANSGDYTRDAVPPGRPLDPVLSAGTVRFTAPGNDLMCGTASAYQLVTSRHRIGPQSFAAAKALSGAPAPARAGSLQRVAIPAGAERYLALRAVDGAGNVGLPMVLDLRGGAHACRASTPRSGFGGPRRHGRRVSLGGRSLDRSCGRAAITRVRVSVARRAGHRCRFLVARGRLGPVRPCGRPTFLSARLRRTRAGRKAHWSISLGALPGGSYVARVLATDAAGRTERSARRDRLHFHVR